MNRSHRVAIMEAGDPGAARRSDIKREDVIDVVVFSSPEAAMREGFVVVELNRETGLYLVEKDFQRPDGRRQRAVAFARPQSK